MKDRLKAWRDRSAFTLADAALLITENHPDEWMDKVQLLSEPPPNFIAVYGGLLIDAVTVHSENVMSEEYEGQYYTQYILDTDKPTSSIKLSHNDGFNVVVTKGDLLKYIKAKEILARVFTDESLTDFKSEESIFDKESETYPLELDIALQAWQAVSMSGGKGKPKARIKAWLDSNSKLTNEAKDRISIVANWDKIGGAPRTD